MSGIYSVNHHLAGLDFSSITQADKVSMLMETLKSRVHGMSFSPYIAGQKPGDEIAEKQIEERLAIIAPFTRWIRTFSCTEGHQYTPRIAHGLKLKTMVGVCLSDDLKKNEQELAAGIAIARDGYADILTVGNEVLLRGDLSEKELLDYIRRVKQAVPDVTVSYVDAYYLFEQHPELVHACDVLSINCYPFWESCSAEYALLYMKEMYRRVSNVAKGKHVIISETGWPSSGEPFGGAMPSYDNALNYFLNTYQWATEEGIEIIYFSSFDESWKDGDEGDVGAHWGLWDQDGKPKYGPAE